MRSRVHWTTKQLRWLPSNEVSRARRGAFFVTPRRGRLHLHASTPFQETRIREPATMSVARSPVVAVAILGSIMLGGGLAQTTTSSSSTSSIVDDVPEWTSKQWNRAKGEWTKEKEKWADCRKQSNDQNLTGLKSWSFLASCMTSRATAGRSSKRTSSRHSIPGHGLLGSTCGGSPARWGHACLW